MSKPVILTGLRANNDLHIGNYLGALLPIVDMARQRSAEYQVNLFMPDLHSFTTPIEHGELQESIMQNLRIFVAAGLPLENENVYVYRQSYIPAHSELTWILDCFTSIGEMNKMTQFKDKTDRIDFREEIRRTLVHYEDMKQKFGERYGEKEFLQYVEAVFSNLQSLAERQEKEASVGLFNYPVLMASDILLYGAEYVPVGEDQTQHLEFTRDIAERMNKRFGELFTVPKPVSEQHKFFGKDQGLRIRDLQNPTKKMSKSDDTGKGVIFLTDSPEAARKKIMSAETDSLGEVRHDYDERPGVSNLLDILKLLGGDPDGYIGQKQYGSLKTAVADAVAKFLTDFQERLGQVDERAIQDKLADSERRMNEQADATLLNVQKAVGLR